MYEDLRSKLNMYKSSGTVQHNKRPDSGRDVRDILSGTECCNDNGCCFVTEKRYPLSYIHGGYRLRDALDVKISGLKRIYNELDHGMSITDFLFLDTETTGLSGGTGTVAFLVGAGFFEDEFFVLRQYFIRDYNEEPAMLSALNGLLSNRKGLVTFNGKAFDWNLLQTRFTFNRIKPALKQPIHIDLLFPSRRIWKLKLESCRLVSLEENILGEYRVNDIPGAMIPAVYFKYLEDRDASEIKRVIEHNGSDIVSMVSLLIKISSIIENPESETDGNFELLGVGKIFETSGDNQVMINCYEACLQSGDTMVKEIASRRLVGAYKRSKNYTRVLEHCENMLSASGGLNLPVMIEMAKHYEHREKDIEKAMEIVETAIRQAMQLGLRNNIHFLELKKRLERLKRKAQRKKDKNNSFLF